jgi:hypothetical protein
MEHDTEFVVVVAAIHKFVHIVISQYEMYSLKVIQTDTVMVQNTQYLCMCLMNHSSVMGGSA